MGEGWVGEGWVGEGWVGEGWVGEGASRHMFPCPLNVSLASKVMRAGQDPQMSSCTLQNVSLTWDLSPRQPTTCPLIYHLPGDGVDGARGPARSSPL